MSGTAPRLVFDHLPKTAGTSIVAAIDAMVGESSALPSISNPHRAVLAAAGARRAIAGHLWFTPGEALAPDVFYCTLLRDPVDRFLSHHAFTGEMARGAHDAARGVDQLDPQVLASGSLDLAAYLDSPDPHLRGSYRNVQAVHFAERLVADPRSLDDAALLEAAAASLAEYDLVGHFGDLQGFIDAIAARLGVEPVVLPRLNVTGKRPAVDAVTPALRRRLEEANQVDARLCEIARERFASRKPGLRVERASQAGNAFGTREVEVLSVHCVGTASGEARIACREPVDVRLECRSRIAADDVTFGIAVRDRAGTLVYGSNSRLAGAALRVEPGEFRRTLRLHAAIGVGEYSVTVAVHRGADHQQGCFHWIEDAARFAVVSMGPTVFEGLADLRLEIDPGS
jgi:hypothetical protein